MTYKITENVLQLVQDLKDEGYSGTVEITNSYASGTKEILGDVLSVQLSGFCKENLYLVEDIEEHELVLVGRYNQEGSYEYPVGVRLIVSKAWKFYKDYEIRGYGIPYEFQSLFVKYGYLKAKTVEVYEEQE